MAAERVVIDTNILVYANQARSPFHERAGSALVALREKNAVPCVSLQILREYYATVTRPQTSGPALDPTTAVERVTSFMQIFHVLPEGSAVGARLFELATEYGVFGKQIHDANIVSTMLENGVSRILTANPSDFRRFADLISIEPL